MDTLDSELISLLNRLNKVQTQVGGPKSKNSHHTSALGDDGKIDRFIDLKNQMADRLNDIRETMENVQRLEQMQGSAGNPKELISAQSKIRTELTTLNANWGELDSVHRAEAKKKRSKFTPEEMSNRQQILTALQMEIQNIKEMQVKVRASF